MTAIHAVAATPAGLLVVRLAGDSAANTTAVPTTVASSDTTAASTTQTTPNDPSPLSIVPAELFWAGGSFIVLLLVMRLVLYPRVAKAMEARSQHIRDEHRSAEREREGALGEKQQYEAELASARAEANGRVDAARAQLDEERKVALADAHARLGARRQAALAEVAAARAAAMEQIASATADVASHAATMVLGRPPDAALVRDVVSDVISGGAR